MKNINLGMRLLNQLNPEMLILTRRIKSRLEFINDLNDIQVINDARSAAFFALGKCKESSDNIVLIVDEGELSNTLSGLTEAYYQFLPLVVITYESTYSCNDYTALQSVTQKGGVLEISDDDSLQEAVSFVKHNCGNYKKQPVVIIIKENSLEDVEQKANPFSKLSLNHLKMYKVFSSYSKHSFNESNVKINERKDEYGMISVFFGSAVVSEKKCILFTDAEHVLCDINAFEIRNVPTNAIIVMQIGEHESVRLEKWLLNKNIMCKCVSSMESISTELLKETKELTVLLYNNAS